jgi:hypothetical protein
LRWPGSSSYSNSAPNRTVLVPFGMVALANAHKIALRVGDNAFVATQPTYGFGRP